MYSNQFRSSANGAYTVPQLDNTVCLKDFMTPSELLATQANVSQPNVKFQALSPCLTSMQLALSEFQLMDGSSTCVQDTLPVCTLSVN